MTGTWLTPMVAMRNVALAIVDVKEICTGIHGWTDPTP